jgi:hypothetical protein
MGAHRYHGSVRGFVGELTAPLSVAGRISVLDIQSNTSHTGHNPRPSSGTGRVPSNQTDYPISQAAGTTTRHGTECHRMVVVPDRMGSIETELRSTVDDVPLTVLTEESSGHSRSVFSVTAGVSEDGRDRTNFCSTG